MLTAFYLGLYAGLRISECFALRWCDVKLTEKKLTISRQMHYVNGEIRLCPVKTLTSIREIVIPQVLWNQLVFQKDYQEMRKSTLGRAYRDTERVYDEVTKEWIQGGDFVNRKANGELLTVNSMKYWAKIVTAALNENANRKVEEENDIGSSHDVKYKEFKYHYLRHTYATNCAAANVSLHMLMSMMGHKKIDTTRKYYINTNSELMMDRTRNILDKMNEEQNKHRLIATIIKKDQDE